MTWGFDDFLPHSRTLGRMKSARDVLGEQYLEMRGRILALAADFDRIQRAGPDADGDPRLADLKDCARELLSGTPGRAERVQMRLSDPSPPPAR
jgi:hypothetical protein